MQDAFQLIERCRFPVICGIDGNSLGGAIDLISACDIVYCTEKSKFAIKEIDLSIIADMGTLNRLPITTSNWGLMKELCFTGEYFCSDQAKQLGLISKSFSTLELMNAHIFKVSLSMSKKSPIAMTGTKRVLNYVRSNQVEEGLKFVKNYNMSQTFTKDFFVSFQAFMTKTQATYPKL